MSYVLVVEDDEAVGELLKFLFEEEGYKVQVVQNGAKAFKIAVEAHPTLIMLDIYLPDLDGLHLYRQLLAHPVTDDIPVIFISVEEGKRQESLALGAKQFISKPFRLSDIAAVVREIIQNHNEEKLS